MPKPLAVLRAEEERPLLPPLEEATGDELSVALREERPLISSLEEVRAEFLVALLVALREERSLSPLEGGPLFELGAEDSSLLDFLDLDDILESDGEGVFCRRIVTSVIGDFLAGSGETAGLAETSGLAAEDLALDSPLEEPVTIGE